MAKHGGILGGLTFMGEAPSAKTDAMLDKIFEAAMANGLDLDFHVDESDSPKARSLGQIADAALRHKFKGRIVAGHCCSLALADDNERATIIAKVAEAGIAVVSLPMCNMYLQDRQAGRTPRWRGVAPLHELAAAGVTVMVASDNTPAGLVLMRARTMNELLSRPQTDRVVLCAGKQVDRMLPDYRELD